MRPEEPAKNPDEVILGSELREMESIGKKLARGIRDHCDREFMRLLAGDKKGERSATE
jgi:hypothetical protein